jgi:hypothetical protein
MSSSSTVQNGQPSGRMWPNVAPYLIPPVAASFAIIPEGMKVECFRQSMRGAPMKALAVGGFSVFYKIAKDTFQSYSN